MAEEVSLQKLYPDAIASTPILGCYLAENLHLMGSVDKPFIYGNYVSSIDGRIALPAQSAKWATPNHLTTASDWHLFKELQAQADCLITHSGYLRALAGGTHGNNLQIPSDKRHSYLRSWRQDAGLAEQPHILIVSRTLDFPWPEVLDTSEQAVSVLTSAEPDHAALPVLKKNGVQVFFTNTGGLVTATDTCLVLQKLGLRSAYLQSGPELLQSMLSADVLRRLYLTLNLSLIGGSDFLTMLSGNIPLNRKSMQLRSLYLRNTEPDSGGTQEAEDAQLFAAFDL